MGRLYDKLSADVRYQEGLRACINCGTCTAVCPAAEFYNYDPRKIANILQSKDDAPLPNEQQIEESFQEAGLEAEIDFDSRMDYVEDLLHSGALSQGDLVETVKSQQIEIAKLRKENNFIKMKLTKAIAQGFKD